MDSLGRVFPERLYLPDTEQVGPAGKVGRTRFRWRASAHEGHYRSASTAAPVRRRQNRTALTANHTQDCLRRQRGGQAPRSPRSVSGPPVDSFGSPGRDGLTLIRVRACIGLSVIMREPTIKDWNDWEGSFSQLPALRAFPNSNLPDSWLPWWSDSPVSALLETGKSGRYTILAPQVSRLLLSGETATALLRLEGEAVSVSATFPGPPLPVLRTWTQANQSPRWLDGPPFTGGLIGFFSYDLARLLEALPDQAQRDLDIPLAAFAVVTRAYVYDHHDRTLYCSVTCPTASITSDESRQKVFAEAFQETQRMKEEWDLRALGHLGSSPCQIGPAVGQSRPRVPTAPRFSFSRAEFIHAVEQVQDYIRAGHTYQTNLSIRETRSLQATPEEVYEKLRVINPSPYMALLRLPGFSLVSGSPELLVKLHDRTLEARPIAGTRPRGTDSAEDDRLNRDLIENSKERAEHLMLVDLIRNDIGRVSLFGSVRVTEFMTVENYSHVMHIVSHIEGTLTPHYDLFDAIAATFPGGTITGAPKVRTMEIIDELEPVCRGPYTGSIGWISYAGDMELNITIRTLLALNGEAHVQAGAGIVIDSDPAREYQESLHKARALWAAVEAAEAELHLLTTGA